MLREIKQISISGACVSWHGVAIMCVLGAEVLKTVREISKIDLFIDIVVSLGYISQVLFLAHF